jgi:transposase
MEKRKRRSFSKQYKAEVVELIRKSGKSIGAVARELDLSETAVRRWVQQAEIDSGRGPAGALTTAEREELAQLRRRVKTLEMEREVLKKATLGSTSQRNTFVKLFCWSTEALGFCMTFARTVTASPASGWLD